VQFLKDDVIVMERNFYGTLRVRQTGSGDGEVRRLLHGVILHGEQLTKADSRNEPGTYYARTSGVGEAIITRQALGPVRIGVVGLGVGTLSAYGRGGDTVRFYELDPDVLALARREFGYLNATPAKLEFALGDARLSLERELASGTPGRFDVLALDRFTSDSIHVHLIPREPLSLYLQHLKPGGLVAIHISNRFLDLKPVLGNIAQALGVQARIVSDPGDAVISSTDWVLFARTPDAFTGALAERSEPLPPRNGMSVWSDQFNNLLDVLKTHPLDDLKDLFSHS
jgi:SAM-dependent methyltransferase